MKKKLRTKIMVGLLAFFMLFCSMDIEVFAERAEEEDIVHKIRMIEDGPASEYGYQAVKFVDEDGNVIDIEEQLVSDVQTFSEFPEKYNIYEEMEMPSIKNQGSLGLCWAHAGLACAEASMILQGLAEAGEVDYSELHLAWFTNGALPPETDPMEGDMRLDKDGNLRVLGKKAYNTGGNIYDIIVTLAKWSGAADEKDAPYPFYPYFSSFSKSENAGDVLAESMEELHEDLRYNSAAHLQEVELYASSDRGSIKQAIMEHGSVYMSYYTQEEYYNKVKTEDGEEIWSYFSPIEEKTNHAVTIVGWDDNFDRENFSSSIGKPKENGAWIVKNSWGEKWGMKGFFYMSYEEPSFLLAASVHMENNSNYNNNYQYDGSAGIGYYSYSEKHTGANQFTAKGREMIKAVGFYTGKAEMSYTIDIYTGGEDPLHFEEPKITKKGTLDYAGYHTVLLEDKIELKEGEEFAVALNLYDNDGKFYIYLDNHVSKGSKSYSYLNGWKELEEGNCRVKVYTNDIPPEAISSIEVMDIADPAFRQLLDREAICRTEGIETVEDQVSVVWKDGETELSEDTKAGVGIAYTASVTLTAKEGYYFFEDLIVKFGDTLVSEEDIRTSSDNKTLTITYTYKPIEEIKSVELTELAFPEGGKDLPMQITCNNPEVEEIVSENMIWKKEKELVSGKAEYHTVYNITITLKAKEGYAFTDATTVAVNFDSAEAFCSEDGKDLTVTYTFPITPKAKLLEDIVSSITIDGIANGTKKTVEDLGLPEKIAVKTEDEAVKWVTIIWDLESLEDPAAYDPTIKTEQVFQVNGRADFEAILIDANGKSDLITAMITVSAAEIAGAPVPDKIAGIYTENQTVKLTSSTEGASIYYVLDETKDPLQSGIKYTDPILLEGIKGESKVIIIKAVAVREDMRDSSIVTFQYTINLPEQEYNITVTNDGNGTASASMDHAKAGEEITLKAAANTGYRFKEWKVTSGSAVIVNHSFVMPKEDVIVHAAFEKNKSSKPSSGSSSGSGSSSSSNSGTKTDLEFNSNLTSEEQRLVNSVLGSNTKVQTVIKCSTGKLIISSNQEIVFCENNTTLSQNKWQKVEQTWYYFGADKKAVKGWLWNNNKWYFMNSNNKKMETGWLKTADGKWYLLDKQNGDMKSGWQLVNGKWYYLDLVNGDMKSDWQLVNGKWYYLDLVNGDMKTGWIKWNGKWYYLSSSGEMLTDMVTPDGYTVDKDGVWIS